LGSTSRADGGFGLRPSMIEPCTNRSSPDNPYYRGLGCADFSEGRRLVGAGCTIGGFSPIASENLTRQSPRREVLLAPAHRPRCISSRSPPSMKPKLKLCLVISESHLSRYSRTAGSSNRPPARAMVITAKRDRAKILGRVAVLPWPVRARHVESRAPIFGAACSRQTCSLLRLPSGLLEEPGCTICEGFVPPIVWFGSVAKASIFPKSDPIARIHFVFRIDQIS
jgi:hypothetical protein